ncbi:MAG: zinc ribbon domain-containing protein, partial [Acidobacteria bacterium]|nr:zinc ribbon domain-containing protein [Acidobacteriota bacterium]
QKLFEKGAILLAGPRGAGKTHHMKVAYNKSIRDQAHPLAIYVSFGKYYYLEPLLSKSPSAFRFFHTWVLAKIILGCQQLADLINSNEKSSLEFNIANEFPKLETFVSQVEKGLTYDEHWDLINILTIQKVTKILEMLANKLNRKRVVLLLDDAALTLTTDYMREFFDVFRSLTGTKISPKASVYPGTTEYGPRFHVGHDAVKVDCWFNVEDKSYSEFMDQFIKKRFPDIPNSISRDIINLLKYAAFGIPRVFINLIRDFEQSIKKAKGNQEIFNRVIEEQANLIKAEYLSLSEKMPQYKRIIYVGDELFEKITTLLIEVNRRYQEKGNNKKQIIIGIQEKQNSTTATFRMIKFLIEAGLLYPLPPVKHGSSKPGSSEPREYDRYIPHLLFLIKKRAFSQDRGFNARQIVDFISRDSTKHSLRRGIDTILDESQIDNIKLDLPPCQKCGAFRFSEEQKFCHKCGQTLLDKSRFEACMKIPIDNVPLPRWIKEGLKADTDIRTLEDILSHSDPGSELQKIGYIGPKRSEKINKIIKEYVEEYLA